MDKLVVIIFLKKWFCDKLWLRSARVWLEGLEGPCGSIQASLHNVNPQGWGKVCKIRNLEKFRDEKINTGHADVLLQFK